MRKTLSILALSLLLACWAFSQCVTGSLPLPTWPDASHYWGVMVNVNTAISTYLTSHPAWFSQDKLATDMAVKNVDYTSPLAIPAASATFNQVRSSLEAKGIAVGTYISGTNVQPFANEDQYPFPIARKEDMPAAAKYIGTYPNAPWRQFIDPSDPTTATGFHTLLAADWKLYPTVRWRFVDNSSSLQGGPYGTWSDQMANVRAINAIAQSQGARAIFNTSIIVGTISSVNMSLLISAVSDGGICLETPFPPSVSSSATATANAVAQYRQLLDAGIGVVMIGAGTTTPDQATSAQLKNWAATWRKPTDHLFLSHAIFLAPDPTVYNWP